MTIGFNATYLTGIQLIPDPNMVEWVRRPILPKSKRKRIRRKWMKKYPQGATVPKEDVFSLGYALIAHPTIIERLKQQINKAPEREE